MISRIEILVFTTNLNQETYLNRFNIMLGFQLIRAIFELFCMVAVYS